MNSEKNEEKSPRILIVDDEEDIRNVITMGLRREGFEVESSGDPAQVAASYRPGSYDLVLLDIRMPGMNGFELYRKIRARDSQVRVCFITAFEIYFDEFRRVFPKLRVSCFVRKPVTLSKLAQALRDELAGPEIEEETPAAASQNVRPLRK